MKRVLPAAAVLAALAALAAAAADGFRFSRTVDAPAGGWCAIDLPDEVLDACRPGLPDLRVREGGVDVPFVLTREEGGAPRRYDLSDVETVSRKETIATVDRGASAPLARAVELEVRETEFLKPVVLEASSDGKAYREVARGSLFAAGGLRSTTLRFPANDRRFFRFRLDDTNGPPIRPLSARVEPAGAGEPPREAGIVIASAETGPPQVLFAKMPAANLGVSAVRMRVADPAYERRVRIFERIFFRDEVSRRLVGAGTIRRAPDAEPVSDIAVCDLTGREIEIEIEGPRDAKPLAIERLSALASPPRLLFFAGAGTPRVLLYGSTTAAAPRYDLASVARESAPRRPSKAALGPVMQIAESPAPAPPARGTPVDPAKWTTRRTLEAPARGGVAYLDLPAPDASRVVGLRIVDAANRPVPYLVERTIRRRPVTAAIRVRQEGSRTIVDIPTPGESNASDALTLAAGAPEYFSRDSVLVVEDERDARGVTGTRQLGSARWERRPGDAAALITIPIAPPTAGQVRVEIENGDNPPVAVSRATWHVPYARLDYLCAPGEKLWLLAGNPEAAPPRYDLALIADRVLSSPASASRLGPAEPSKPAETKSPKWLWGAIAGAALLVVVALARTLKSSLPGD